MYIILSECEQLKDINTDFCNWIRFFIIWEFENNIPLKLKWANSPIRFLAGVDFLGYLGCLTGLKVFGLLKWTEVRTFFTLVPWVPLTVFFWTFWAFWIALAGAFFSSVAGALSAGFLGTGFLPLASALAENLKEIHTFILCTQNDHEREQRYFIKYNSECEQLKFINRNSSANTNVFHQFFKCLLFQ